MTEKYVTIGLLTCTWKRHNLSNIILNYYSDLKRELVHHNIILELVSVGSEGEISKKISTSNSFDYIESPNMPLGAKWNSGMLKMQDKPVDAVVITGSDDLLNKEIFLLYKEALFSGALFIGFLQLYFYDLQNNKILFWKGYNDNRRVKTIGLGRCIHKYYLKMFDWKLWSDEINCGLDKDMTERLSSSPFFIKNNDKHLRIKCESNSFYPIDIKTETNMWSYSEIKNKSYNTEFDANDFIEQKYNDKIHKKLMNLKNRSFRNCCG